MLHDQDFYNFYKNYEQIIQIYAGNFHSSPHDETPWLILQEVMYLSQRLSYV